MEWNGVEWSGVEWNGMEWKTFLFSNSQIFYVTTKEIKKNVFCFYRRIPLFLPKRFILISA